MSLATNLWSNGGSIDSAQAYLIRLADFLIPPSLPDALPIINVHTTLTPTLLWGGVSWAVSYDVEVDDDPNFESVDCCDTDLGAGDLSVQTSPLQEGIVYYWRVRAQRANGTFGAWSRVDSFVIDVP
jgi:hypothetical protein